MGGGGGGGGRPPRCCGVDIISNDVDVIRAFPQICFEGGIIHAEQDNKRQMNNTTMEE